MKRQSLSTDYDSFPAFTGNQEDVSGTNEQAGMIDARRQYYVNQVLKPQGIPTPKYIQEPISTSDREQRVEAFKERNRFLKYFIGLIQQKVIT